MVISLTLTQSETLPEPPAPVRPGLEERLEDAPAQRRRDAGAAVGHLDGDPAVGRQPGGGLHQVLLRGAGRVA